MGTFLAGGRGIPRLRGAHGQLRRPLPLETAEAEMHPHSFTCQTMGLYLFI